MSEIQEYKVMPPNRPNSKHMGLWMNVFLILDKRDDDFQHSPSHPKGWEFVNNKAAAIVIDYKLMNSGFLTGNTVSGIPLNEILRHKGYLKSDQLLDPSWSQFRWFYTDINKNGDPSEDLRIKLEPLLLQIANSEITINYLRKQETENNPIEIQGTLFPTNKYFVQVIDMYQEK